MHSSRMRITMPVDHTEGTGSATYESHLWWERGSTYSWALWEGMTPPVNKMVLDASLKTLPCHILHMRSIINAELPLAEHNCTSTKPLYIYRKGYGRLGNLIFWYASTYGVATYHGRKAIWGAGMEDMLKLFPNLNMEFMEEPKGWKPIHTKPVDYDPSVMQGMSPKE